MKREELEALGMTKEQIDGVLDMHHKELDPVQKDLETAQADLTAEKTKTATQETTIKDLKKDLEEFKDADVSGMKQKIEDLEKDIQTKDAPSMVWQLSLIQYMKKLNTGLFFCGGVSMQHRLCLANF